MKIKGKPIQRHYIYLKQFDVTRNLQLFQKAKNKLVHLLYKGNVDFGRQNLVLICSSQKTARQAVPPQAESRGP